jgi:hypothetical protein
MFPFLPLFPYFTFSYTLILDCEPLVLMHCVIHYLFYCSFLYAIVLCWQLSSDINWSEMVSYWSDIVSCRLLLFFMLWNNHSHFNVTLLISVFSFFDLISDRSTIQTCVINKSVVWSEYV